MIKFLEDNGFVYHDFNEYWIKRLGFGRFIIVDHIVKKLFKVSTESEVIFDNYIESFEHFKKIVNKALAR